MCWAKMKCAVEVYNEFARFISTNFIDPAGVQAATATLREVDTRLTAAKEKKEDVTAILEEHAAAQLALDKASITHQQSYSKMCTRSHLSEKPFVQPVFSNDVVVLVLAVWMIPGLIPNCIE